METTDGAPTRVLDEIKRALSMPNSDGDAFLKEFMYGNSNDAVQQRRMLVRELEEKWEREKDRRKSRDRVLAAFRWRWVELEKAEKKMKLLLERLAARVEKLEMLLEMGEEGKDERKGNKEEQGVVRRTTKEEAQMIREMSLIEIKKR